MRRWRPRNKSMYLR